MPSTVKRLEVTYDPVNESNTFACGDNVSGRVTLEVAKDCQINSLLIKFKGKAEVLWTERHGRTTHTYHSKDKYFSSKQYIIGDENAKDSSVLAPGIHVYPFSFQIPFQDLPSSFKGADGKIVYLLEARLSRSMRLDQTDTTKLNFVSKVDLHGIPHLMRPQHESKDKKMAFFTSGTVAMDVNLEKAAFFQGEGLKVLALIKNDSSREIKPKYCIYRKHSFFAKKKRRLHTEDLIKEAGAPIPPSSSEKVTHVITIPHDLEPSILNCSNIKAEYRLRVYLDVKYASDPEIKFDIVILPASQGSDVAPPPSAAGYSFGNPNPPAWSFGPPQPSAEPFGNPNPPTWSFGPPQPSAEPFGNPNPPAWGFGPPQPSAEPFGTPNPPAWSFGPPQPSAESFGNLNPPAWSFGPPQPSAEPQPCDPPPPYGAHGMYPPLDNFSKYQ